MYRLLVCALLVNFVTGHFRPHDHHDSCDHGPGFGPGHSPWHGPGFGAGHCPWHGPGHGPGHDPGHCPGHEHWDHDNPWHGHNDQESAFDRIAQFVGAADQIQRDSCTTSSYSRAREYNGAEFYVLKYVLSEFAENSITVKVKNRVVYVTATKEGLTDFEDLRILPHFLNVSGARWYFNDGLLEILFPYKNQFQTDVSLTCDQADDKTYEIPKQPDLSNDLRFLH